MRMDILWTTQWTVYGLPRGYDGLHSGLFMDIVMDTLWTI